MPTRITIAVAARIAALLLAMARPAAVVAEPEPAPAMLVIGNSITRHGPDPSIGWQGNWGMASSRAGDDYLHQLIASLERREPPAPRLSIIAAQAVLDPAVRPEAARRLLPAGPFRYIIVQAAENVDPTRIASYRELLAALRPALAPAGVIVCIGGWWPHPELEALLASACSEAKGRFVSLQAIGADRRATARSERALSDSGVAAHPGDWAMHRIAERIECALAGRGAVSCP